MHGQEPRIHITLFADANPVDRGLRVHCPRTNGGSMDAIIDATPGDAFEDAECMPVGIKQHPSTGSACPQDMSREGHAFAADRPAPETRGYATA